MLRDPPMGKAYRKVYPGDLVFGPLRRQGDDVQVQPVPVLW